jgi:hypothetical protein
VGLDELERSFDVLQTTVRDGKRQGHGTALE